MSAPIAKSQMAFELPQLSYIDTRWEEPAVLPDSGAVEQSGFVAWVAAHIATVRDWRANARSHAELNGMTERELTDIGLNRGDLDRLANARYNQDLVSRAAFF